MTRHLGLTAVAALFLLMTGCASYQAKPVPFKSPEAMPNSVRVSGATVAALAYANAQEAEAAFGFNIIGAGMVPIQIAFDNGPHPLKIVAEQTYLEDNEGNLWPVLEDRFAYERATRYAQTKEVFKEGAYHAFLGAAAGALVGAAVGVVTGDFGRAVGQGAVIGAAGGGVIGGAKGLGDEEARYRLIDDFRAKSLQNRPIQPNGLAFGFIFFPGETKSARLLRLQLQELDTGRTIAVKMPLR